jgi:RND family efflux transporter MFP subunit
MQPSTMTRTQRTVLIVIAVGLLAGAAFWFTRGAKPADAPAEPAAASAQPRPALTVRVGAPEPAELAVTLSANGNIAAWQEASVGSESAGLRLAEVAVNVGDRVKKGQVLARFAPETINADVAQARAALAEARATAADAAGNAARARTLEQTGALSQQQITQYQTAEQTAKARVEAAQAVLDAQQVRGRNTVVTAPDDGVISARSATVGSVVGSGTELFRLIRQGRLEWRAEVGAADLGRLSAGLPVRVVAPGGAEVRGKVRSIAPTVDPQTRNALVYVDIPGVQASAGTSAARPPGGASAPSGASAARAAASVGPLLPGMFARGEFLLGQSAALTVPQSAVVPRDGFNTVMVLQPDNRVQMRKVQAGRRVGDRIEIRGDLPADARVVTEGAGFLNDGDLVRVVDAAPVAGPADAASSPK